MKANSQRSSKTTRFGADEFISPEFPRIDSAYQSITIDDYRGRCANQRMPSFRNISKGYFGSEARRGFITEAVFFGLIVVVSTWPVMQSVHAMTDLVRAFGGL